VGEGDAGWLESLSFWLEGDVGQRIVKSGGEGAATGRR
jgi:hypothetical protein